MTTAIANNAPLTKNVAGNAFEKLNAAREKTTTAQNTQDRFLKLLITQLQNQDPMNPTDSAQTTSQMAQISAASGIESLNASITNMMSTFTANQSLQATALIGHSVMAKGGKGEFDGSNSMRGAVDVPEAGGTLAVTVYDASGKAVRELPIGPSKSGRQQFSWDGKDDAGNALAAGKYSFGATVKNSGGEAVPVDTYAYAKVDSVSIGSEGTKVRLVDGRDIGMDEVSQIQ